MRVIASAVCALMVSWTLVFPRSAKAQIFGPSTYDECILHYMRGQQSNTATSAVIAACRSRFPDTGNRSKYSRVNVWDGNRALDAVANLELQKTSREISSATFRYFLMITLMNRNPFPIAGAFIGEPKQMSSGNTCPVEQRAYKSIYWCGASLMMPYPIAADSAGRLDCPDDVLLKATVCVVGFNAPEENIDRDIKPSVTRRLWDELTK